MTRCPSGLSMAIIYPLINVDITIYGKSPCYSWVNQLFLNELFRLGHVQVSKVLVIARPGTTGAILQ
jgi:hypothetical protein